MIALWFTGSVFWVDLVGCTAEFAYCHLLSLHHRLIAVEPPSLRAGKQALKLRLETDQNQYSVYQFRASIACMGFLHKSWIGSYWHCVF